MSLKDFSFIICSVDDERFKRVSGNIERCFAIADIEIIRISDAVSLAEGYNRGWRQSNGQWIVFCHDDIELLSPDFLERSCYHCMRFDIWGVVGTSKLCCGSWFDAGKPHIHGSIVQPAGTAVELNIFDERLEPVPSIEALDGLFIVAHRRVVDAIQGFDENLCGGFHLYDIEFTFRAHLSGFKCGVGGDLLVFHESLPIGKSTPTRQQEWLMAKAAFDKRYARYLHPIERPTYAFLSGTVADRAEALSHFEALRSQALRGAAPPTESERPAQFWNGTHLVRP